MLKKIEEALRVYGFAVPAPVRQILKDLGAEIDRLRAEVDTLRSRTDIRQYDGK